MNLATLADVVARPGLAVRPHIALKGRAQIRRQQLVVPGGLGETIVAGEIMQGDVVLVHPVARRDRFRGKTDDLAVFPHGFVRLDLGDRHFVAARHAFARDDAGNGVPGGDLVDGDDDIVLGGKANKTRIAHG